MPEPLATAWVVVGGPGAAAERTRASALACGAREDAVVVAAAGHPAPWRLAPDGAEAVRLLPRGDEALPEGHEALMTALATGAQVAVAGHRVRAPGRWGELARPPADLGAERLVLDRPVELAALAARPAALAGAEEVAPDLPGGSTVLMAGLAATAGLTPVDEAAAVVRRPMADLADRRTELTAVRTILLSRTGASSASADTLRRRLLELAFLDPAGPLDLARDPAALWGDPPAGGDPAAFASILHELHHAVFALAERIRWADTDLASVPAGPPPEPVAAAPAVEVTGLVAELERLNHLLVIADERDAWREEELAALRRELAAAHEPGATA